MTRLNKLKASLSLLSLFLFSFSFSFLVSKVHQPVIKGQALENNLNLNIEPVLTLQVENPSLNLNLSANLFDEVSTNINVTTNNLTGYTLTLSDSDESTSLAHQTVAGKQIISLSSQTLKTNFPGNHYGYSLNGTDYFGIPTLSSPRNLKQTDAPGSDQLNLKVGARVDETTLSGTYSNTLVLSLTANRIRTPIFTISTMQEMTTAICEDTTTPYAFENGASSGNIVATTTLVDSLDRNLVPERTLIDTRDNKTYVVRKLADGRCWMVQNLDLDLNTNTALTNQNTDLNSKASWTPENSTQNNTGVVWGNNQQASSSARSYNPGDKYLTGTGDSNQTVSDSGPKTAHSGNLYNWYAATAGSGTYNMTTPGQAAPDSICPKGWKLPYGNNNTSQTADSGDFRKLTNTYGITIGASDAGSNIPLADRLLSAPLNFIRSGHYNYSDGQFHGQGSYGYFWSSSVYSRLSAHSLDFFSSYVYPQNYSIKGSGFAARCIAR